MDKLEEIFRRNLPNIPYKLEYIYIYDWLILGNLQDAVVLNTDAVLSVFNEAENYKEQFSKKDWLVINILDSSDQNIEQHFDKAFEFLDNMEKQNKTCIIHCHAGINRSATIALAYFIKKTGINLFDAYEFLSLLRPGIIYNIGFRKQLISWATENKFI
jgi:protein-tyrosine phosphatase